MNRITRTRISQPDLLPGRRTKWCGARSLAITLLALALLLPCLLADRNAAASDFSLHIQDDTTGESAFVNVVTGDYLLVNRAKRRFLAGRGKLTVGDCTIEWQDSGAKAKRPDRNLHIIYDLCERTASVIGEVFASGESFALRDSDTTNNDTDERVKPVESTPTINTRFEFFCLQDERIPHYVLGVNEESFRFQDYGKDEFFQGAVDETPNGCKRKAIHIGGDPKKPNLYVYIEYNLCTYQGSALIWDKARAKTYVINDRDMRDSLCPKASRGE